PAQEHYEGYATHVGSAFLNLSWPVERTHPERAGTLSPVTCRWFEAAASGAVIAGQAPKDPVFEEWLGPGAVLNVPDSPSEMPKFLEGVSERWVELRTKALRRVAQFGSRWSWNDRVSTILALMGNGENECQQEENDERPGNSKQPIDGSQ